MINWFKRLFGLHGTYKWALRQANSLNYKNPYRKSNKFRLHYDHIGGMMIVYKQGFVSHDMLFSYKVFGYVPVKEVGDYYKPTKEDKLAMDWTLEKMKRN